MSTIIFDFDGTLVDSFEYVYSFLAREAGNKSADNHQVNYRGMSMKDMALALGIPLRRLPFLYFRGRRQMRDHILRLEPFPGMVNVIQTLHAEGHTLAIVSSNSTANVRKFLVRYNLQDYFASIKGGAGIFGKVSPIKQLRTKHQHSTTWYVGDEVADIASAKAASVKSIAVTWGFGSKNILEELSPDGVAQQASDILKIVSRV